MKYQFKTDKEVIQAAGKILEARARKYKRVVTSTNSANQIIYDYLKHKLNDEREHFLVVTLDNGHAIIDSKIMFSGTVNGATVHPREIVKKALHDNAAAIIIAHNHPSGNVDPSEDDKHLTHSLINACKVVDVTVLDHIIVGHNMAHSFAATRTWPF